MTLWILALISALWWLGQAVCIARTLRSVRPLRSGSISSRRESSPTVSVICPARDEGDAIESAVQTRLSDPAPWLEFIFVDDRSEDETGEILDRLCAQNDRAQVVHNRDLPEGWLGKVHAQQIGVDHASIDLDGWYLFSDGDTHVRPGAIESAIAWAEQEDAAHVSLIPRIVRGPWLLRLCLTPLMRALICTLRLWRANDDRRSQAMGVGAFNLVRRDALERAGGLEQLRLEIADDVGIARIVQETGGRSRTAIGSDWVEIEWYRTTRQFLRGTEKGVAKARTRAGIVISCVLGLVLMIIDIMPFVLMAWLPLPPAMLGAATASLAVLLGVMVAVAFRLPRWWALLSPFGTIAALLITLRAMMLGLMRGGIHWRGDTHSLAVTSDGERVRL